MLFYGSTHCHWSDMTSFIVWVILVETLFFVGLVIFFWNLMLFVLLGHLADYGVEIGMRGEVGMWQIDVLVARFAMGHFSIWNP